MNFLKSTIGYWIFVIILGLIGYFIGYFIAQNSQPKFAESFFSNVENLKGIAQVSTLSVTEGLRFDYSNKSKSTGEFTDLFKSLGNYLYAKQIQFFVPAVAKYGVDLDKDSIQTKISGDSIILKIPDVKLLSFEFQMDKKQVFTEKGLMTYSYPNEIEIIENTLFKSQKAIFEKNEKHKKEALESLKSNLTKFFSASGLKIIFQ